MAWRLSIIVTAAVAHAWHPEGKDALERNAKWNETRSGAISWAETKCMLRRRRIAFLGDSNSRFHWMTFNWFLETGELRSPREAPGAYYDKWGHRGPPDYDKGLKGRTWTDTSRAEGVQDAAHRQWLTRTFEELGTTSEF
jgi:hypothetical protein